MDRKISLGPTDEEKGPKAQTFSTAISWNKDLVGLLHMASLTI